MANKGAFSSVFSLALGILGCLFAACGLASAEERNLAVKPATPAATTRGVALVIGNGDYLVAPLRNPVNDAKAIAAKLRTLGFEVIERENLTQKKIGGALREFRSKLQPGGVALFFYAGHGLQVKGVNYLPVVDAEISSEEDVPLQSVNTNQVLELMDEAKTRLNLVFLDACRNNPYARSFRSAAGGLAKVNAPSGTIISFATRPGSVASDGSGKNGLYTEHLLDAMDVPGQPIEQVLKRVVSGVKKASEGKQEPWMEGSIEGDFYFINGPLTINVNGSAPSAPPPPQRVDAAAIELEYWKGAQQANSVEALQSYLAKYPGGQFSDLARIAVAKFASAAKPLAAAPRPGQTPAHPRVEMKTNLGSFTLELYPDKAPRTVENFLKYVGNGFYRGTLFHRVIDNFMIQGGGLDTKLQKKADLGPIPNEADNGLKNEIFSIAMARTMDPDSATAQFFVNVNNNVFLDHTAPTARGWGYAVFGKVVQGQETVMKIARVRTGARPPLPSDVPLENVVIEEATLLP